MKRHFSILSVAAFIAAFVFSGTGAITASADEIVTGDVDGSSTIDTADASAALEIYAMTAAGLTTEHNTAPADVDENGIVDLTDAALILTYYAQSAAGMSPDWNELLGIDVGVDIDIAMTGLGSQYARLLDDQKGEIIAEKNAHTRVYHASMTKIMTAIVTIENFPDVNSYVTVPSAAVNAAYSLGGSTAGFGGGNYVPMLDLLYGMLLPSGCECCISAAMIISGSESAFVELMNQKAQELGMTGTHYANTTGLPNSDHYTTAYDMTVLMRYAIGNDIFRQVDTTEYHTAVTGLSMRSTMFKSLANNHGGPAVTGGRILGGKTGTTNAAGSCLCSFAEINGREYILCTTKASGGGINTGDAKTVYNRVGAATNNS